MEESIKRGKGEILLVGEYSSISAKIRRIVKPVIIFHKLKVKGLYESRHWKKKKAKKRVVIKMFIKTASKTKLLIVQVNFDKIIDIVMKKLVV